MPLTGYGSDQPNIKPNIMRYFEWENLPTDVRDVGRQVCELATWMETELRPEPERLVGVRKVLEALDCISRCQGTDRTGDYHPAVASILRYFAYGHLPVPLQTVSKRFGDVALAAASGLMAGPELTTGLRKLLEAKDCAVRAAVSQ